MKHPSRLPIFALLGSGLLVSGCSREPSLMPLHVGRITSYMVRSGFDQFVAPMKVSKRLSVAGVEGYELTSNLGATRLGWRKGVLYASDTANAHFDPPVPILALDNKPRRWEGRILTLNRTSTAAGELKQSQQKLTIGGTSHETTEADLTLKLPKGTIELSSWFEPNVGLVEQEQRTNSRLVLHMEILGTPQG